MPPEAIANMEAAEDEAIDQCVKDLVDFALWIDSNEGKRLSRANPEWSFEQIVIHYMAHAATGRAMGDRAVGRLSGR